MVTVEAPVAVAVRPSTGQVMAVGVGAGLLRFRDGQKIGVRGSLDVAPVRVRAEQFLGRDNKTKPFVSLQLGPFQFLGYKARSRRDDAVEAMVDLLDGRNARVVLPENVFAQPGSVLTGAISWSRRHGWRSPYRLASVSVWRPREAMETAA